MAQQLDEVVVVELTLAAAPACPPAEDAPVLEVGACLLRVADGAIHDVERLPIHPGAPVPEAHLGPAGLKAADLEHAIGFLDLCEWLRKRFYAHQRPVATWTADLPRRLRAGCVGTMSRFPFGPTVIEVRPLASLHHRADWLLDPDEVPVDGGGPGGPGGLDVSGGAGGPGGPSGLGGPGGPPEGAWVGPPAPGALAPGPGDAGARARRVAEVLRGCLGLGG